MKNVILKIVSNELVGLDTYKMKLTGDLSEIKNPGEFVEISIPGYFLRRPISVSEFNNDTLILLYKVLGHGTKDLTTFNPGMTLDTLVGLGNGFEIKNIKKPLLVSGGIGIAPMVELAKKYNELGIKPTLVYGANSKNDIVLVSELAKIADLHICTMDGTLGYKGNAVDYIKENIKEFDYYYACGPMPMLKALATFSQKGCLSLEARMGCGFGACMGCSIETTKGPKRVCKEGPVFLAEEVIF